MERIIDSKEIPVEELIKSALEARKKSYAPYSGFKVGAALLTGELRIYTGCNIENAAYSPGICAERTAIYKAVSEGRRSFLAIAVAGGREEVPDSYAFPCGVCRQVMGEFCSKDFHVIWGNDEQVTVKTLEEILPHGFNKTNL